MIVLTRLLIVIVIAFQAGTAAAGEPIADEALLIVYERRGAAWQCPDRRMLDESLNAHLGEAASTVRRQVAVTLAGEGDELWAEARLVEGDRVVAERFIVARSNDCAELIEAVALVLAIALSPEDEPDEEEVEDEAEVAAPAAAPAITTAAPPVSRSPGPPIPAAEPRIRYAAGLGMAASVGSAPGLATGMTVEARARRRGLSLGFEYRHDLESLEPAGGGAIGTRLQVASVVPCAHRGPIAACAIASVGALHGQGHDLDGARADATPYVAYGARVAIARPVGAGMSLRLAADLLGISTSTTVRVGDMEIWSTGPAAASVGLAAFADFP